MTNLAYNLYRLFALDLDGYSHNTASTLFTKFIANQGKVNIDDNVIEVEMKKKRNLPALMSAMNNYSNKSISWIMNKHIWSTDAS
jgi:hypothetical protein